MLLFLMCRDWLGNVCGDVLVGIVVVFVFIFEVIVFFIIVGVDF